MKVRSAIVGAAVFILVGAGGGGRARADVAAQDACSSAGQPCQNAGPNHDKPGTCVESTCSRRRPGPNGTLTTTEYACSFCRVSEGGGGSGGGGSGSAGSGHSKSSSGCAVGGTDGRHTMPPTAWLFVGLGLLVARRRKIRSAIVGMAVVILVGAFGGGRARADLAPPDACTSPGQPCQNAGSSFDKAGTCVATTCQKSRPAPDGGFTTMEYDCNLCRVPDGGVGGSGGGASGGVGGSGGGASGSAGSAGSSSSSGCSVAGTDGRHTTPPTAWLLVGLGLLAARRRKTG